MSRIRLGFVCEIVLGHGTLYDHVVAAASARPDIELVPTRIPFEPESRLDRLPPMSNWTVRASYKSRAAIRASGPVDALLINSQTAALFCGGVMRRVPTIISSDATPANYDELAAAYVHSTQPAAFERVKRQLTGRVYRRAATVLAWTDWVRDSLVTDYAVPPERVAVISPGLPIGPEPEPRQAGPGPPRVLFVGADFDRKGGPELLAAACDQHVEVDVVTRSPVAEEPGVRVHRDLSAGDAELRRLYAEADIFVLPTRGDSYGWVLLEAMEAGLPVISTPVGGIPSIVKDGVTGLLVPPGDVGALTSAIEALVSDPQLRARMGAAGRRLVSTDHDASQNMAAIFRIVQELVGRS